MIWLLRIEVAGRTWYLSSVPCEPERAGVELAHHGALSVEGFSEDIDATGGSIAGTCSVSATLHLGDLEGWRLARDGQVLDGERAEVALWRPGTPYAAREVLIRGYVAAGGDVPPDAEAIQITITSALVEDAAEWPDPDDVTTATAWPSIPADEDDYDQTQLPYPMPLGALGVFTTETGIVRRTSTVEIIIVDATPGAEIGVVAGAPISDTLIRVWNDTTKDNADLPVSTTADGDGVLRATVDMSGGPLGWLYDGTHRFYATDLDGGLLDDRGTGSPTTLGAVALFLLLRRYGDIGLDLVDVGEWRGLEYLLAGWTLGLQIEPADPLQIISDELLALCPALSIVPGPRGQRPVYLSGTGYGRRLIVGRDLFRRQEAAVYPEIKPCNAMTVSYAPSAFRGDYRGSITIDGASDPLAAASADTLGVQREKLESKATYDRGTAGLSGAEHVRLRARRQPMHVFDAPYDVAVGLALGDRVRLVDEDRDLNDRAAWVVSRDVGTDGEVWSVGLLLC